MIRDHYRPQRNWGARLREFDYRGSRMIVMENEKLQIGILAGRGSDIVEISYKPHDMDFAWLTPRGVRDPTSTAATSPDLRAPFQENYPGGWQEIFPNGGSPSSHEGASYVQHGELFNAPWDVTVLEDSERFVSILLSIRPRKTPVLIEKTITLRSGELGFQIEEGLFNEAPVSLRAMWGHHITFGPPFLQPGSRIRLPESIQAIPHPTGIAEDGRRASSAEIFLWPIDPVNETDFSVLPEHGTSSEVLYLTGFPDGCGWYEINNPDTGLGARVEWDANVMPWLWYWQEFGATKGHPWWGRNFNIGLEPFAGYPNMGLAEAVKNDTALTLAPNSETRFTLRYSILDCYR